MVNDAPGPSEATFGRQMGARRGALAQRIVAPQPSENQKITLVPSGMAHGWATLEVDEQGNHRFELRMYERTGEGQFELMSATSTRERLLHAANDINVYTAKVINLFHRIYLEKGLEKPE